MHSKKALKHHFTAFLERQKALSRCTISIERLVQVFMEDSAMKAQSRSQFVSFLYAELCAQTPVSCLCLQIARRLVQQREHISDVPSGATAFR